MSSEQQISQTKEQMHKTLTHDIQQIKPVTQSLEKLSYPNLMSYALNSHPIKTQQQMPSNQSFSLDSLGLSCYDKFTQHDISQIQEQSKINYETESNLRQIIQVIQQENNGKQLKFVNSLNQTLQSNNHHHNQIQVEKLSQHIIVTQQTLIKVHQVTQVAQTVKNQVVQTPVYQVVQTAAYPVIQIQPSQTINPVLISQVRVNKQINQQQNSNNHQKQQDKRDIPQFLKILRMKQEMPSQKSSQKLQALKQVYLTMQPTQQIHPLCNKTSKPTNEQITSFQLKLARSYASQGFNPQYIKKLNSRLGLDDYYYYLGRISFRTLRKVQEYLRGYYPGIQIVNTQQYFQLIKTQLVHAKIFNQHQHYEIWKVYQYFLIKTHIQQKWNIQNVFVPFQKQSVLKLYQQIYQHYLRTIQNENTQLSNKINNQQVEHRQCSGIINQELAARQQTIGVQVIVQQVAQVIKSQKPIKTSPHIPSSTQYTLEVAQSTSQWSPIHQSYFLSQYVLTSQITPCYIKLKSIYPNLLINKQFLSQLIRKIVQKTFVDKLMDVGMVALGGEVLKALVKLDTKVVCRKILYEDHHLFKQVKLKLINLYINWTTSHKINAYKQCINIFYQMISKSNKRQLIQPLQNNIHTQDPINKNNKSDTINNTNKVITNREKKEKTMLQIKNRTKNNYYQRKQKKNLIDSIQKTNQSLNIDNKYQTAQLIFQKNNESTKLAPNKTLSKIPQRQLKPLKQLKARIQTVNTIFKSTIEPPPPQVIPSQFVPVRMQSPSKAISNPISLQFLHKQKNTSHMVEKKLIRLFGDFQKLNQGKNVRGNQIDVNQEDNKTSNVVQL